MLFGMSHSGRQISALSAFPFEEEVLFMPGTEFVIDAVDPEGDGLVIEMREIADEQ